ncbi:universal stress protein [Stieleria sp. TO1_6]|uniref:universal stress protein n=1 Tax=Stieleria tagensis TaxID=2956795 RepID=UPI00209B9A37|nr:universal stress protein [Stieleria tagensis]MCO8125315.1 universal stress protein [Stieleria tagensis]
MTSDLQPISEILVPIDFAETSVRALRLAMRIASPSKSRLHLLHVVDDPMLIQRSTSEKFRDEQADKMSMKFIDIMPPSQREQFQTIMSVRFGTAYHEIETYAQEQDIDLIVMGNISRSLITDALLGSVAAHIIRHAKCPVLTISDQCDDQ